MQKINKETMLLNTGQELNIEFIHGAGGTESKWRKIKPYFTDEKTTYVNLLGREDKQGESAETIEKHAENLASKIKEETVLVGHSMGGLVGLEVAKINPLVKGLVLIASSYELPVHPSILDSFNKNEFPDFLFKASYTKNASDELINEEEKEKTKVPSEITYQDFVACNEYKSGAETLSGLDIPVLALFGSEDNLLSKDSEEKLKEAKPNILINKVDGEKHYLILESPQEVSKVIKSFSKKL